MTNRSSQRVCARTLLQPYSKKPRPNDAEPLHRIPLTDSAKRAQQKLQLACIFSLVFMSAEALGGFFAGSLAIMTDATRLLSDTAGFCISLFAIWMSTRPATSQLTFGFQRAEAVGAVTSVLVVWVLTGVLVYEAALRFVECLEPNPRAHVDGRFMFTVAAIGLIANLVLMKILGHGHSHGGDGGHGYAHGDKSPPELAGTHVDRLGHDVEHRHSFTQGLSPRKRSHSQEHEQSIGKSTDDSPSCGHYHSHGERTNWVGGEMEVGSGGEEAKSKKKPENLNIWSAYLHALGQSLAACIAGGLIWYKPEWQIADPVATFIFSVLVLFTTVGIIRDSIHILTDGTPDGIHAKDIERGLRHCSSVVAVHDLHIWSLSAGLLSLTVHLVSDDAETALHAAQRFLMSKGITHTTIQIEKTATEYPCDCNSDLKCGQKASLLVDEQLDEASWV